MSRQTCVYRDEHVTVFRSEDDAADSQAPDAPFYSILAGEVELTYDVQSRTWYVYMPGRERMQTPVSTDPYYLSEQGFTMVNIDWDYSGTQVFGIEILGGSSRESLVVVDVPDSAQDAPRERAAHLRVIRPEDK